MKVNRMWAMFDAGGRLNRWTIRSIRLEVIDEVERNYGMKWRHIYARHGYKIKKVVVLRADDFEELLAKLEALK